MTALPEHTDVLIIGYGPVGATLANLLGDHGVDTLVIDKSTEPFPLPRAIALDNEALRILQMAGLPEGSFETLAIPTVRMRSRFAGDILQANTCGTLDGHPKLVTFHQPELEAALRLRVEHQPTVRTALGLEIIALDQKPDGISATLQDAAGNQTTVCARYLVGADGASSWVREQIGQSFTGKTYGEAWLIVDAKDVPNPIDHVEFICDPERPTPRMPAPNGRERWEFKLRPDETAEEMENPEKVRELLAPWGNPDEMNIERTAVYRFHARSAESFQSGRVFLAGDAAHITPPFAGQGLCAGLRDAANLAWKLAWVLDGKASASILETYTQERQPHAKAMIELAKLAGHLIMPASRTQALATHSAMRAARINGRIRAFFDDLEVKPRNRFRHGLFAATHASNRLQHGAQLPQCWLRGPDGRHALSDDVLGNRLMLVGFGRNPEDALSTDDRAAWRAAGGGFLHLCHRGQQLHRSRQQQEWEDLEGRLIPGTAPMGWIAVIRPDRVILHDGPIHEAGIILQETLQLIDPPASGTTTRRAHA